MRPPGSIPYPVFPENESNFLPGKSRHRWGGENPTKEELMERWKKLGDKDALESLLLSHYRTILGPEGYPAGLTEATPDLDEAHARLVDAISKLKEEDWTPEALNTLAPYLDTNRKARDRAKLRAGLPETNDSDFELLAKLTGLIEEGYGYETHAEWDILKQELHIDRRALERLIDKYKHSHPQNLEAAEDSAAGDSDLIIGERDTQIREAVELALRERGVSEEHIALLLGHYGISGFRELSYEELGKIHGLSRNTTRQVVLKLISHLKNSPSFNKALPTLPDLT